MLQFLVLGFVPGTSFQISFTAVALLTGSLIGIYEVARIVRRNLRVTDESELQTPQQLGF